MKIEQEQRIKKLKKIICDIRMMRHGTSPAMPWIAVGMLSGYAVMYIFSTYIYRLDTEWVVAGSLISGIAGPFFMKYKTWDEHVYAMLTEYQPLDLEAYREIQALAGQNKLTSEELLKWAHSELETITIHEDDTAADIARKHFATVVK